MNLHTHTYTKIRLHACAHMLTWTHTHIHTHKHTHAQNHVHTHRHTCTCTHTHTQPLLLPPPSISCFNILFIGGGPTRLHDPMRRRRHGGTSLDNGAASESLSSSSLPNSVQPRAQGPHGQPLSATSNGRLPPRSPLRYVLACFGQLCVCACVCMRAHVRACVRAHVRMHLGRCMLTMHMDMQGQHE